MNRTSKALRHFGFFRSQERSWSRINEHLTLVKPSLEEIRLASFFIVVNPIRELISLWGQWDLNIAGKWVQYIAKVTLSHLLFKEWLLLSDSGISFALKISLA